jgi:hypothetical protein
MKQMRKYEQELTNIQQMLKGFIKSGTIDTKRLSLMNNLINWSEEDQFKILNNASLSLDEQRPIFGAVRNINVAMKSMKERLELASEKHENPKTAELALELMPSFFTLVPEIDAFLHEKRGIDLEYVSKFSRILYRKANSLGFSKDVASQLSEAKITHSQVKTFLENLKKNVTVELDIEEEVTSTDESSNRNINAS